MKTFLLRAFFKILRKNPAQMDMVRYWKNAESVQAKVIKRDGCDVMQMDGEKYIFPGYPRGYLLYGKLSKLKHEIKNQVFNESWALLEEQKEIAGHIENILPNIYKILDDQKFEILPPEKMSPAVREIHRAWTKVSGESRLRDTLCHILQEDDGYRFRVQWLAGYFNPNAWYFFGNPIALFDTALAVLEHAEVIGDMKERQRLLRRVLMTLLKDEKWRTKFLALVKEIDWNKVKLTKADKYFFRGKFFKVDFDRFSY